MVQAVGDIITFNHHPFGNNYFATKECGAGPYSSDQRHCWAKTCVDNDSPPADCFTGDVVTQHGPNERAVNKVEACAINLTNGTAGWREYWPFVVCMETYYVKEAFGATKMCAAQTGLNYDNLMACYNGPEGVAAEIREAKATTDHGGTPDLTVNGTHVTDDQVLAEVCRVYTGDTPDGCRNLKTTVVKETRITI